MLGRLNELGKDKLEPEKAFSSNIMQLKLLKARRRCS